MIQMDLGLEAALNLGNPASAAAGTGARASLGAAGGAGRTAAPESASFQDELQAACRAGNPSSASTAASGRKAPAGGKPVDPQHAKVDSASGCRENTVDAPAAADIASILLQLLQGVASPATTPASASEPPAAAEEGAANEDAASEMLARVLELLKQMASSSNSASPQDEPDMARLAELLDQLDELSGAAPPAALAGKVHQLLTDLHAHLSGVAWGKMVKEATADGEPAAAEPGATGSPANDAVPSEMPPIQIKNRPEAGASETVRTMQTPVPVGSELKANPAESRSPFATVTSTEAATPANAEGEPPSSPHASAAFPAAANSGDGHRGAKPRIHRALRCRSQTRSHRPSASAKT